MTAPQQRPEVDVRPANARKAEALAAAGHRYDAWRVYVDDVCVGMGSRSQCDGLAEELHENETLAVWLREDLRYLGLEACS